MKVGRVFLGGSQQPLLGMTILTFPHLVLRNRLFPTRLLLLASRPSK